MKTGLQTEVHSITLWTAKAEDTLVFETVNHAVSSTEFSHSTINDLLAEVSAVCHPTRSANGIGEVLSMTYRTKKAGKNPLVQITVSDLRAQAALWCINERYAEPHCREYTTLADDGLLLRILREVAVPYTLRKTSEAEGMYEIGKFSGTDLGLVAALALLDQECDRRYPGQVRIPMSVFMANRAELDAEDLFK